jgi:hypothetical protein
MPNLSVLRLEMGGSSPESGDESSRVEAERESWKGLIPFNHLGIGS